MPRPFGKDAYYDSDGVAIFHGDCLEVLPAIPAGSIDFVLTDPPYLVDHRGRWDGDKKAIVGDDDPSWLRPAYREIHRAMKADSFAVTFYGWPHADLFVGVFKEVGFRSVSHLAFVKNVWGLGRYTRGKHETAYLLAKGRPRCPGVRSATSSNGSGRPTPSIPIRNRWRRSAPSSQPSPPRRRRARSVHGQRVDAPRRQRLRRRRPRHRGRSALLPARKAADGAAGLFRVTQGMIPAPVRNIRPPDRRDNSGVAQLVNEFFPMNPSVRHATARKLAYELVGIIATCLREEEQREALREFYEAIRAGLDEHDAERDDPGTVLLPSIFIGDSLETHGPRSPRRGESPRYLRDLGPGPVTDG